ncbi:MAG: response regulator transcription factor [Halapricum sp.]
MWGTDAQRRVVVVDDDPGCRELHRHWLGESHEVRTASTGADALDTIDEEIGLVLLDREMPGLSGADVVDRLRARDYGGYIVMVTGVEPDFDVIDLAIDDYLVKPISESELTGVVERLWARQAHHEQLRELFSLAAKKARLEVEKDRLELARNDEYQDLRSRLAEKRTEIATDLDGSDWQTAFEACVPEPERYSSGV